MRTVSCDRHPLIPGRFFGRRFRVIEMQACLCVIRISDTLRIYRIFLGICPCAAIIGHKDSIAFGNEKAQKFFVRSLPRIRKDKQYGTIFRLFRFRKERENIHSARFSFSSLIAYRRKDGAVFLPFAQDRFRRRQRIVEIAP